MKTCCRSRQADGLRRGHQGRRAQEGRSQRGRSGHALLESAPPASSYLSGTCVGSLSCCILVTIMAYSIIFLRCEVAPEIIDLSGCTPESDIWSAGLDSMDTFISGGGHTQEFGLHRDRAADGCSAVLRPRALSSPLPNRARRSSSASARHLLGRSPAFPGGTLTWDSSHPLRVGFERFSDGDVPKESSTTTERKNLANAPVANGKVCSHSTHAAHQCELGSGLTTVLHASQATNTREAVVDYTCSDHRRLHTCGHRRRSAGRRGGP